MPPQIVYGCEGTPATAALRPPRYGPMLRYCSAFSRSVCALISVAEKNSVTARQRVTLFRIFFGAPLVCYWRRRVPHTNADLIQLKILIRVYVRKPAAKFGGIVDGPLIRRLRRARVCRRR